MKDIKKAKDLLNKLFFIFTKKQKAEFVIYVILSFIGGFIEMLGVSVMLPLVQALMNPEDMVGDGIFGRILRVLHITDSKSIIIFTCLTVIVVYLVKNVYLVFLSYYKSNFSLGLSQALSTRLMDNFLHRPYTFFLGTNISELLTVATADPNLAANALNALSVALASVVTVAFIIVYAMITDVYMALTVIILASICLIVIVFGLRGRMRLLGEKARECSIEVSRYAIQAFEGVKEIKVSQRQDFFVDMYSQSWKKQKKYSVRKDVALDCPQRIIETICIIGMITYVAFRVTSLQSATVFIPKFAVFAVAAFRILPLLGTISGSFNSFMFACPSIDSIHNTILAARQYEYEKDIRVDKKNNSREDLDLEKSVVINSISWTYPEGNEPVLRNLSMEIVKGKSIGIIGQSGAGKSTLMDVILGLYVPQQGTVEMDGHSIYGIPDIWSRIIGYVPQTVYLIDDSIRNNVAFGIKPELIDDKKVWNALNQAHIDDYIDSLPDKLNTFVGDRGIRLSGGQRQRIAIARALYYNPEILVFDEATSALDNDTEKAVMESIEGLQGVKTLLIVAHRLSTVQKCDEIYEIKDGRAIRVDKDKLYENS